MYKRHQNWKPLDRFQVDIVMTCYENPIEAVGVIGDSDGAILKTLRSDHLIPTVLVNDPASNVLYSSPAKLYRLHAFIVVADSAHRFARLLDTLGSTVWGNDVGNILVVDVGPNSELHRRITAYMHKAFYSGYLKVQVVSLDEAADVWIYDCNPFTRKAPEVWNFQFEQKTETDKRPMNLFARSYQKGSKTCQDLHFEKTTNVGGYPIEFSIMAPSHLVDLENLLVVATLSNITPTTRKLLKFSLDRNMWVIDNIVLAINASAVVTYNTTVFGSISMKPHIFGDNQERFETSTDSMIMPFIQIPLIAVTNHTGHKSQLKKILSVIDTPSQIGNSIVYLLTFIFFKFCLGQAVTPALLNLVRLTCNSGLTRLPRNLAPSIYLAGLLMYVVTLQGIYTGNLATLLTSTIPYPNVETKLDIPKLGYTVYIPKGVNVKLSADPILEEHITEVPPTAQCEQYLRKPLAACVMDRNRAAHMASKWKLHASRESIKDVYIYYASSCPDALSHRIERVMRTWTETGLNYDDTVFEKLQLQFVEDDEVKNNEGRRVMTMGDLGFAFVILGVGLMCSFVCFIGEIVIYKMRLTIAKRRDRVRVRVAWGVNQKKFSLFPSLSLRYNSRLLLSTRR